MPDKTTPGLIVDELRRHVELQVAASTAIDTKAAGLIAATFALVALVVPRVQLDTTPRVVTSLATFGLVLATLMLLAISTRPRIGGFSYGPDAADMLAFLEDDDPPDTLEKEIARAYGVVRGNNEAALQSKAESLINGIKCLIATVVGLAIMLAAGGIK
jgi:hypothetical protein